MTIIILLAALALIGLIATIIEVRRDGLRAVATDWTRVAEHDGRSEAESSPIYR